MEEYACTVKKNDRSPEKKMFHIYKSLYLLQLAIAKHSPISCIFCNHQQRYYVAIDNIFQPIILTRRLQDLVDDWFVFTIDTQGETLTEVKDTTAILLLPEVHLFPSQSMEKLFCIITSNWA